MLLRYPVLCLIVLLFTTSSPAQRTAFITGDTCLGSTLTLNTRNGTSSLIKWWFNDTILQQVRGKWGKGVVVAGDNGPGSAPNQFYDVEGIFVDKALNLYVVDNTRIQRWAYKATQGTTVAGGNGKGTALNQFYSPYSVWVDSAENVYVSDYLAERVVKWAKGATTGVIVAGGHGDGPGMNQFYGACGICMDRNNNLYIADRWNCRVMKWAPGASYGTVVAGGNGKGSALNQLEEPFSVAVDTAGNVYVCDTYNHRITKWAPGATTGVIVAGGNGPGNRANQLNTPWNVSVDPSGNVYVSDGRIQKWAPGATYGVTVAGGYAPGNPGNISTVYGMCLDNAGSVYISEIFSNRVRKFSPAAKADSIFTPPYHGKYKADVTFNNGGAMTTNLVNMVAIPPQPQIYGSRHVIQGKSNILYSVVDPFPDANYSWTVPPDAVITSGQGTASIRVTWGTTDGYVSVTGYNTCGTSKTRNARIYSEPPSLSRQLPFTSYSTGLSVYPNPAVNDLTLRFVSSSGGPVSIYFSDAMGRIIMRRQVTGQPGTNIVHINVSAMAAGTFFAKLENSSGFSPVFKGYKR